MSKINYFIILFIFIASVDTFAEDNYYYTDGQQWTLTPISNKVVIGFNESGFSDFSEIISEYPDIIDTIPPLRIGNAYFIFDVYPWCNLDGLIESLNNDTLIEIAQNAFYNESGRLEAFNNNIVVKCEDWLTQEEYDSLLNFYDLIETGISPTRPTIKYVTLHNPTHRTVLETANRLYEEEGIKISHPMLCAQQFENFYTPLDSLYPHQWYLYNEFQFGDDDDLPGKHIDMETAWEITCGDSSIIIAVIDVAFSNHRDLPSGAFIDSLDAVGPNRYRPTLDSNCYPLNCLNCGHGYAVTGIIMADHDNKGVAGIAPNCKLIFIKHSGDDGKMPTTDSALAEALVHAAHMGAKVISNSWGAFGYGPTDDMINALNEITNPSIAGYSCTVIFAAGNAIPAMPYIAYPGNLPQTLAVGATDSLDKRWYYSCYGDDLDVMAPSGDVKHYAINNPHGDTLFGSIVTFDQPGDSGYTTYYYEPPYVPYSHSPAPPFYLAADTIGYEYYSAFCGTSASCPQVAGIAALVMSRRPDLADSNYTIYIILKHSAEDQVGPPDGYTPDLPGWDQYYGWGRANAYRALLSVIRGDVNNDGVIDMLDITYLIQALYKAGPPPEPDWRVADVKCDGNFNVLDISYLIAYLYKNGPEPPICFTYEYESYPDWW